MACCTACRERHDTAKTVHSTLRQAMLLKTKRVGSILVYTVSMYLVTHLIVLFFLFPVGVPLLVLDATSGYRIKKRVTGMLFTIIGQRLKVTGLDRLEPDKKYVVVSNYPGSYAGFALMNVFPDASIFVHSFLSKVPIVGFLLKRTGATFVRRRRYGRSKRAIDEMLKHLENRSIVVLPEGGRSPDGRIRRFKRGFIYVLRNSSMDLLPVTLNGFHKLKPVRRAYVDPDADLELLIHKPVSHAVLSSLSDQALLKLTKDMIEVPYRP